MPTAPFARHGLTVEVLGRVVADAGGVLVCADHGRVHAQRPETTNVIPAHAPQIHETRLVWEEIDALALPVLQTRDVMLRMLDDYR
ncbi:hypothetical protein [Micromonospora sp. LOL_023]|uniref:hypothetical protein n=1 Tax=Micromonospora sp. LOL_023 TaxID=3345418 RepID=UPI003A869D28